MLTASPWFTDAAPGGTPMKRAKQETVESYYLLSRFAAAAREAGLGVLIRAEGTIVGPEELHRRVQAVGEHLGAVRGEGAQGS